MTILFVNKFTIRSTQHVVRIEVFDQQDEEGQPIKYLELVMSVSDMDNLMAVWAQARAQHFPSEGLTH